MTTALATTTSHRITLAPAWYGEQDAHVSPNVIQATSRYVGRPVRLGLGYVGPRGTCRREQGGPVVPGPCAFLFPLSSVIDNHGGTGAESARLRKDRLEFDATVGDVFLIGGYFFRLTDNQRWSYPSLDLIEDADLRIRQDDEGTRCECTWRDCRPDAAAIHRAETGHGTATA